MFDRIGTAFGKPVEPAPERGVVIAIRGRARLRMGRHAGAGVFGGPGRQCHARRTRARQALAYGARPCHPRLHVGEELRARAQLGLRENVAAMVMNRPLSDCLEQDAYERSTDHLQTSIDASLPQEVRWLAMYLALD